jgi:hydrogenase nickel incorporation protein HypB
MEGKTKVIEINENVYASNDYEAEQLRKYLKENGVYMLNFMSSPGSGKTTTLTKLINALKDKYRIALMNVDIKTSMDANKIAKNTGIDTLNINNGGLCHIDADMTSRAIKNIDLSNIDLLILENIGNLVCPAEFDTGANKNVMILSIPEGDDKPLKYPLMFSKCDLILINKIDVIDYFNFDFDKVEKYIHNINKDAKLIKISAKTGEGINTLADIISKEIEANKSHS